MPNGKGPGQLLTFSELERKTNGLRNVAPNSDIVVYKANADGTRGKVLRVEKDADNYTGDIMPTRRGY